MSIVRRFMINVFSNWANIIAQSMSNIVLFPYLTHALGDDAYGVWQLMASFLVYMSLLDLGLSASVQRYAARFAALKSADDQCKLMSTAMVIYLGTGLLAALACLIVAPHIPDWLEKIPANLRQDTIQVFYLGAAIAFLRLISMPFIGFLYGIQRYDLANVSNITMNLLRFGLTILFVQLWGPHIILVAWAAFLATLPGVALLVTASFRSWPGLKIRPSLISRTHFRDIAHFGVNTFILTICGLLVFQFPNFVLAKMLGTDFVTDFAVGLLIQSILREIVRSVGAILVPMFAHSHALNEKAEIEARLWRTGQICNTMAGVMIAGILVYAKPLILYWTGDPEKLDAYGAVVIFMFGYLAVGFEYVTYAALSGCGYLRGLVITEVMAATLGVVITIWGIKLGYGLNAAAAGIALPMFLRSGLWQPWYTCHKLKLSLGLFLRRTLLRPVAASLLVAAVALLLRAVYTPGSRTDMIISVVILAPVTLLLAVWVGLSPQLRLSLLRAISKRVSVGGGQINSPGEDMP